MKKDATPKLNWLTKRPPMKKSHRNGEKVIRSPKQVCQVTEASLANPTAQGEGDAFASVTRTWLSKKVTRRWRQQTNCAEVTKSHEDNANKEIVKK
jgi:hypothetical protein